MLHYFLNWPLKHFTKGNREFGSLSSDLLVHFYSNYTTSHWTNNRRNKRVLKASQINIVSLTYTQYLENFLGFRWSIIYLNLWFIVILCFVINGLDLFWISFLLSNKICSFLEVTLNCRFQKLFHFWKKGMWLILKTVTCFSTFCHIAIVL